MREMAIMDLQKRIGEGEGRLKQQQNLYEAVRADRNLYSKNLIEAQDEIQEMKRKFRIMQHQIEQLKEEISAKDLALVKEHFDHMKVGECFFLNIRILELRHVCVRVQHFLWSRGERSICLHQTRKLSLGMLCLVGEHGRSA